ncbi:MAG: 4-hydroxythreonine-4-phosphate dehydrogenase PdxA [Gammaproteobacteria bacterium]|nr:4-hydroxythreonine-4-phosphate dehydrogenase PdxA [Gammaproteobacteria bacterium]
MPEFIPRIAVSPGEPAGIGPDLCVLLADTEFDCQIICYCDPRLHQTRAAELGRSLEMRRVDLNSPAQPSGSGVLHYVPVDSLYASKSGQLNIANAGYVLDVLTQAALACQNNLCDALVTGPIHKGIINQSGIEFSGHTEYLGELCQATPLMMLASPGMRVALLTTHIPLLEVPAQITAQRLHSVLNILHGDLKKQFGIDQPRIMVCGLNPHAGEDGHMGREEVDIIEPELQRLREQGMTLIGPLPADTVFTPRQLERCDVVLAMYHDQGLPALKQTGFGQAVNITLGLPIIRTSVDHGTALDLAGTGQVDTGSMQAAIELAAGLARKKHSNGA